MHMPSGRFRFERLQWTFPIAVTLHSLEEAIWLPAWAARHSTFLPWTVSAVRFRLAVAVLTLAAYVVTWVSIRKPRPSVWTSLFVAYTFAVLLNVFVPHVPASILLRSYTPGVVTAVAVNLPVTTILLALGLREGVISSPLRAAFVFGIPTAAAIVFAMVFAGVPSR